MFEFTIVEESRKKGASGGLYDVVIVGGGPAGLTTAIYTGRDGLKTLVLDRESTGGLAATTEMIENYPGFPEGISGIELMERFRKQAERFGAEVAEYDEVIKIEPVQKGLFKTHTERGAVFESKTVVLATGSEPKKLNVPGEEAFYGRGVSYCATCDGPFFKNKEVVIIGTGNSSLQEGLHVLEYAKHVTFVVSRLRSRAEQILQDRVKANPKSTFVFNHQVLEIKGEQTVTGVTAQNRETQEETFIPADGVFIYVGYSPYSRFVADLVETDRKGYIVSDQHMRTKVAGLYAIGDVRADNPAQSSVSVGNGAIAALDIRDYILELEA